MTQNDQTDLHGACQKHCVFDMWYEDGNRCFGYFLDLCFRVARDANLMYFTTVCARLPMQKKCDFWCFFWARLPRDAEGPKLCPKRGANLKEPPGTQNGSPRGVLDPSEDHLGSLGGFDGSFGMQKSCWEDFLECKMAPLEVKIAPRYNKNGARA